jgi:preprotein translocase subunit SecY
MNSSFPNIGKIPELKKRLAFTFFMLIVYRIGAHIPTPGINSDALASFFAQARGTLLGLFDMFSGGALERLTVFALGIMPYISASIIFQLLTAVIPQLDKLSKEGEVGRRKITQYTRYATILLSMFQGFMISIGLENMTAPGGAIIVANPGWSFRLMTMITLSAGTAFIMWIGEQITERGIGNGISLIIFAGILVRMPNAIINTVRLFRSGELSIFRVLLLVVLMVGVVGVIIFAERGQRKVPIQYPKRVVGRRVYGGQSTHLPLKMNTSGVIPPIFASSLIMFPATIANFVENKWMKYIALNLTPGKTIYELLYIALIFFFCYFYTAIIFNPMDIADNLKKFGGFIPGIRPGKRTAEYIDRILVRITFGGAIYVSAICVLPSILITRFNVPFYFGGTSLLIVVGVALDTIAQIESHLVMRHYDGFLGPKGTRFRGRRR